MDNLQSVTYQTFEQDPVKYHNYEEVINSRLFTISKLTAESRQYSRHSWIGRVKKKCGLSLSCLSNVPLTSDSILCVAGAGRGPLVARSLSAIERSGREAFVYAVEKNPNAYIT
jgi:protein arginine N-methyltransferase 5